jgi:hypothetical protein
MDYKDRFWKEGSCPQITATSIAERAKDREVGRRPDARTEVVAA